MVRYLSQLWCALGRFLEFVLLCRWCTCQKKTCCRNITARKATQIKLSTKETTIKANNYDVAHIIVQLTDENGNPAKTDDREITFEVKGNAKLLGIDNGWKNSVQKFQTNTNTTHNGKTLLIIQAKSTKETIEIVVEGKTLKPAKILIDIK